LNFILFRFELRNVILLLKKRKKATARFLNIDTSRWRYTILLFWGVIKFLSWWECGATSVILFALYIPNKDSMIRVDYVLGYVMVVLFFTTMFGLRIVKRFDQ